MAQNAATQYIACVGTRSQMDPHPPSSVNPLGRVFAYIGRRKYMQELGQFIFSRKFKEYTEYLDRKDQVIGTKNRVFGFL